MHRNERFRRYASNVVRLLNTSEQRKQQIRREIILELSQQYKVYTIDDPELILGREIDTAKAWQEKIDSGLVPLTNEYVSSVQVGSIPLVHITKTPNGVAKGIIAIGPIAIGVIAIGGISVGVIGFGGIALSVLFSFGGLSLSAFLSFGSIAISGLLAIGGLAFSYQTAIGGFCVAKEFAVGGVAHGKIAVGDIAKGLVAVYSQSGTGEALVHVSRGYEEIRRQILKVAPDFPKWLLYIIRLILN
ncbi:MAG TPA: hypothetical protein PKN02_01245 [Thermotogota bacterium]|jgi:hypothetical protein|nr:MAG: hypothetical protein BWX67_02225 [Thermotogota bacterium ADurb.Bin062]HNW46014.1 hypothetical protein [Thermotogota bacterium]HQK81700.1 hypothetical protein [Thermotogota bacterium]